MALSAVLQRFVQKAPMSVMTRMILEAIFAPDRLNQLFQEQAQRQYTREFSFAQLVDIMSAVVCRMQPSVHAAYREREKQLPASVVALYDKLKHLEPATCRALLRYTAEQISHLIDLVRGRTAPLLPGYRCRILDGNHLAATEHRLQALRDQGGGMLPGQCLAVLDAERRVVCDLIPCEDAYRQESQLAQAIVQNARPAEVYIADRQFCTSGILLGLSRQRACFVIRRHRGHLRCEEQGPLRVIGQSPSGLVLEQAWLLFDPDQPQADPLPVRQIVVKLVKPTRDGEWEIELLSNLPESVEALAIAQAYAGRWQIEDVFCELTVYLRCEIQTLGYPKAALSGFCVACCCYNLLSVLLGVLRSVFGGEVIDEKLSHYYISEELGGTYRGLEIAVEAEEWSVFGTMDRAELAEALQWVGSQVDLNRYRKSPRRSQKRSTPRPEGYARHQSTARLLNPDKPPNDDAP